MLQQEDAATWEKKQGYLIAMEPALARLLVPPSTVATILPVFSTVLLTRPFTAAPSIAMEAALALLFVLFLTWPVILPEVFTVFFMASVSRAPPLRPIEAALAVLLVPPLTVLVNVPAFLTSFWMLFFKPLCALVFGWVAEVFDASVEPVAESLVRVDA